MPANVHERVKLKNGSTINLLLNSPKGSQFGEVERGSEPEIVSRNSKVNV